MPSFEVGVKKNVGHIFVAPRTKKISKTFQKCEERKKIGEELCKPLFEDMKEGKVVISDEENNVYYHMRRIIYPMLANQCETKTGLFAFLFASGGLVY